MYLKRDERGSSVGAANLEAEVDRADREDLDDEALLEAAVVAGRALHVDRGERLVRHAALSHGVGLACNRGARFTKRASQNLL